MLSVKGRIALVSMIALVGSLAGILVAGGLTRLPLFVIMGILLVTVCLLNLVLILTLPQVRADKTLKRVWGFLILPAAIIAIGLVAAGYRATFYYGLILAAIGIVLGRFLGKKIRIGLSALRNQTGESR